MKKLIFLFAFSVLILNGLFASMAPYDYDYAVEIKNGYVNVKEIYTSSNQIAIPVKEEPSEDSSVLFYITDSTPLKVIYTNGNPIYNSEGYVSYYIAILLPPEYREKGYSIGWINGNYTWWEENDKFDSSNLSMLYVNSYLENSMWKFRKTVAGKEYSGIICFNDHMAKGIFITSFDKSNKETQKEFSVEFSFWEEKILKFDNDIKNYDGTTVFNKGEQKLSISRTSFNMQDGNDFAVMERINPLSFSINEEERHKDYHNFAYSYLLSRCNHGFRLWQKDSLTKKNVFQIMNIHQDLYKPELTAYFIANGVLPLDSKYEKEYNAYWNPYIIEAEKALDKNIYNEVKFPEVSTLLKKNKKYFTTDHLRLRKSYDTKSEIITTLDTSDYVEIIKFGKVDVIDGIISCWVKVKVLSDSLDVNGKTIAEDTEGWCFAGYLKEND